MRGIKFRAWDTKEKKMLTGVDILICSDGSVAIDKDAIDWDFDFCEPKLMQFTGVTDRSGNDIYEGDIVKEVRRNPSWDEDMVNNFPVTYNAPSFMIGDLTASDGYFMITREVIGNIHQNPELIKAT